MQWLDEWEQEVKEKKITTDQFLTSSTAEGLRVTILSTLNMIDYLYNLSVDDEKVFKYVLTAKLNQDCVEVIIKFNFLLIYAILIFINTST